MDHKVWVGQTIQVEAGIGQVNWTKRDERTECARQTWHDEHTKKAKQFKWIALTEQTEYVRRNKRGRGPSGLENLNIFAIHVGQTKWIKRMQLAKWTKNKNIISLVIPVH